MDANSSANPEKAAEASTGKNTSEIKIEPPATTVSNQPPLGSGNFVPSGVTPGTPTGTFVGKKVVELRSELNRLQSNISQQNGELQKLRGQLVANSRQYHGTIAAVNARLQVGTTPGNPILVQQFKSAQGDLSRVAQDIAEMNNISSRWSSDMKSDSWLSKNTRPMALIFLTLAMTIFIVLDSTILLEIKDGWVSLMVALLITVYVAYFGSRGAEKITKIKK